MVLSAASHMCRCACLLIALSQENVDVDRSGPHSNRAWMLEYLASMHQLNRSNPVSTVAVDAFEHGGAIMPYVLHETCPQVVGCGSTLGQRGGQTGGHLGARAAHLAVDAASGRGHAVSTQGATHVAFPPPGPQPALLVPTRRLFKGPCLHRQRDHVRRDTLSVLGRVCKPKLILSPNLMLNPEEPQMHNFSADLVRADVHPACGRDGLCAASCRCSGSAALIWSAATAWAIDSRGSPSLSGWCCALSLGCICNPSCPLHTHVALGWGGVGASSPPFPRAAAL